MEVFHGNPRWAGPRAGINTAESQKAIFAKSCQMAATACAGGRGGGRLPCLSWGTSPCAPPASLAGSAPPGPPQIPRVPASHGCSLVKPGVGHRLPPEAVFSSHVLSQGCVEKSRAGGAPGGGAQSSAVGLCGVAGGPQGRTFPPSRPCAGMLAEVPGARMRYGSVCAVPVPRWAPFCRRNGK